MTYVQVHMYEKEARLEAKRAKHVLRSVALIHAHFRVDCMCVYHVHAGTHALQARNVHVVV